MLHIKNLTYKLSERFSLGPMDLKVSQGDHIAVIGESGCGKTTFLKLIHGLYDLDHGSISWNNQQVTGPKDNLVPGMSYSKYLSQDFDLMPYTTVAENINKHLSRLTPEKNKKRTHELLEVVEMSALANVKVKTLSGGQMQRVALAQTLAKEPELLLLDEPFSHIDNFKKNKLRRLLFSYLKQQNITCIVATHDSTDVLSFMDQVVVMKNGAIICKDQTNIIYNNPPSYYVGSLFGDLNELPKNWFYEDAPLDEKLLLYPHQLGISLTGIQVTAKSAYFMGSHYLIAAARDHIMVFFNHSEILDKNSIQLIDIV